MVLPQVRPEQGSLQDAEVVRVRTDYNDVCVPILRLSNGQDLHAPGGQSSGSMCTARAQHACLSTLVAVTAMRMSVPPGVREPARPQHFHLEFHQCPLAAASLHSSTRSDMLQDFLCLWL